MRHTRTYHCYHAMLSRCYNRKNPTYERYGARGIRVCAKWRKGFTSFFADMGACPDNFHSIERKNNMGHYAPSNCRWATTSEQANNTRRNRVIEYNGKRMNLIQWERETGINRATIHTRLTRHRWSVEKALTVPPYGH